MQASRHSTQLALCLATIYLVWGSSFLFTKMAVASLPVALFSGMRFLSAGCLLMTVARFTGQERFPTRLIEWRHVAVAGFFMVLVSNGLNAWAIQYIPSNQSALLNGTSAFWIAGLGVFGKRGHPLTARAIAGLAVGFLGAVLMLIPKGPLSHAGLLAQCGVLTGCFGWSLGTLYYRSIDTELSSLMFMALQMFMGGLMFMVIAALHGDVARWAPSTAGLLSMTYLTIFSSCLAYTAYGWLAVNSTPTILGTYSYINPMIAAYLGWQFRDESLSRTQLAGMVIIIGGVLLLTLPRGVTDSRELPAKRSV